MRFRPNPLAKPARDPQRAGSGRHRYRAVGTAAAVAAVLAVSACGTQKALTPPATPPPVAVPIRTTTTPAPLDTDALAQTVVTGDSTDPATESPTTETVAAPSPAERTTAVAPSAAKPAPPGTTANPQQVPATVPAATPAANKIPVPAAAVTGCGNPNPGKVLLTFDDGGPKAPDILAILQTYNVKARWFPTGAWAAANAPFMARLTAAGQLTGNHTYSHPQMLSALGTPELTRQVQLGYHPTTVFRFPYGASDETSRGIVSGMGYSICPWSIDTLDWKGNSADTITTIVTGQARPGAVVLMHQSFQADIDALPRIIQNLRGRGLI